MVHYLNPGQTPLSSHAALTMAVAKLAAVTQHAGVPYLDNTSMAVPPGVSTATKSYALSQATCNSRRPTSRTNMTNQTFVFGKSAKSNVMCISLSVFYPVSDPSNPVIGIP